MRLSNKSIKSAFIIAFAVLCPVALRVSFADTGSKTPQQPARDGAEASTESAYTRHASSQSTSPCDPAARKTKLWGMSVDDARCRSIGCLDCHSGIEDIHNAKVNLGCID